MVDVVNEMRIGRRFPRLSEIDLAKYGRNWGEEYIAPSGRPWRVNVYSIYVVPPDSELIQYDWDPGIYIEMEAVDDEGEADRIIAVKIPISFAETEIRYLG